ncbi:putative disease resistance protein RGA4 [Dendrobium catenatum]|nr:putative disease resistance protein RGA4 [Dendrobium catenatum]
MADMFLDPIMEKLISAGLRYLKDQARWQKRAKEELEKLKEILPQIQAVVHFASSQERITDQNPALNKWLWKLRDAIDDADDVLDELEYMELEKQLTKNKKLRKVRSIMKSMKKRLVKIGKRALKIDPNLKRLEEAVQKLYGVSTNVSSFLYLVKDAKQEQQLELYRARETGSSPKNDLIGRGKEKELVMEWLGNPSNEPRGSDLYRNISLLSIVGHGGMGKTTLLQHIYEDEMTKEFDLKMWVCVSNNFDAKEVIADMLELLKKERPRLEKLEALHERLKNEVMSKKFLLVLDDIWEEEKWDQSKWENVLAPLASGGCGSKILVTTRTDSVALMFANVINKKKKIVRLEGLEEDECLQLLNSHAFAGVENPPDDHKKLRAIAGEIVKKLLGSPLATKVIGGVLKENLDERHWRTVLESNLLDQNSINSILRLSYIVLPNSLKSCFAFCGMFAQDHVFDKDDLIRMWIALGFIHPSLDQEEIMEDIGGRYFDVLVKKNFFDKFGRYYKMHDLIHELAQLISIHECLRVENSTKLLSKIHETLRHLSIETTNLDILRKIEKFKHLHSLFLVYEDSNPDLCSALIDIFKASRCLRLLYIRTHELKMIPEEIRYLKHLRYLKIKIFDVTRLPRSLSNLYHLQYIIYHHWRSSGSEVDDFLPSDINNLSNLRHMKLPKNFSSICGIGKLKSLQELSMFDLRDVSGYKIWELENMNDLCKLGINCLENLKDAEEACDAQLCEKKRLTDLTLCWRSTYSRNIDLDENVLDNLQPPKCLRNLRIKGYMGARSTIWMNNVNPILNLEKIELTDCLEWETLPPFGQLPFLKSLKLDGMPKVKWLESKFNGNDKYHAFPLLEELHITKLEALEDWFEAGVAAEDGCLFPCLIELVLRGCPMLKELPSLPSKLKTLEIQKIGWTTLNFCSNSNPIPLETLEVIHCPNITSLPLADEIARLAALRYLMIIICPNLISLGRYREVETTNNCHLMLSDLEISDPSVLLMEPLRSIASLKELRIMDNDELVSFPNEADQWFLKVRSSLSELKFMFLESLESLPSSLESLSSLQNLHICDVPMLRELPNLSPSLHSLYIKRCHPELKERYREDGGSDRHKIAHIPSIEISTEY